MYMHTCISPNPVAMVTVHDNTKEVDEKITMCMLVSVTTPCFLL